MQASAQVFKIAFTVQAHIFVAGDAGNDFGLVVLPKPLKYATASSRGKRGAPRARPWLPVPSCAFDGHQILRREGALVGKVVIKTVFDHRADGDLGIGNSSLTA